MSKRQVPSSASSAMWGDFLIVDEFASFLEIVCLNELVDFASA